MQARAGGKIILLGEHSVVYGYRALAGAIDRGVTCKASPCPGTSSLRIPAWDIEVKEGDDGAVGEALRALLKATDANPVSLDITTNLPAAAGLGSSAALCLAIARCLAPDASDTVHRDIAAAGEAMFHERPSGIDVALSQYGGIASYDRSTGLTPLSAPPLPLVVGLSNVPRSTATQVANVATRVRTDGGKTESRLAEMGVIADIGIAAIEASDLVTLGECMDECHRALCDIGVSIEALDSMVKAAKEAGALGAKLTGAGGGGAIIALAPGNEEAVCAVLEEKNFDAFVTTLGAKP